MSTNTLPPILFLGEHSWVKGKILVTFILLIFIGWIPIIGSPIAGFLRGYVAKKGLGGGALVGFIGGLLGGIIWTIILTVLGGAVLGIIGALAGLLVGGAITMMSIMKAITAAIGGLIGGLVAGRR